MNKHKIIIIALLIVGCIVTFAYSQENPGTPQTVTVSGALIDVDYVGATIVAQTDNGQMTFSVPDEAVITKGSEKDLGLEDVENTDGVTIQYYISSEGQNIVTSIVDTNLSDDW